MEFNFKRDINKTVEMIEKSKEGKKITDPLYNKTFYAATVNHNSLYNQMSGSFSSFLGITGSMSSEFSAINLGANNITCFDISLPTFCYAYFQIASVLGLDYDEYIQFIFNHKEHRSFNFETYQKIREYLPNINPMDVRKYYDVLYDYIGEEDFRKHYFMTLNNPKSYNVSYDIILSTMQERNNFLDKESFYKLKSRLKTIKFTNLWMDIREIPEFLYGQHYDKIYLSCANHFIYDLYELKDLSLISDYISLLEEFKRLLVNGGQMQASLFYGDHNKSFTPFEQYEMNKYRGLGYKEIIMKDSIMVDVAYVYKKC